MLWTCWTGEQCFWRSLSLSFGCLSPFVCLLWMSLLYLSQSVIWVFVTLCLSTQEVSVVPVSVSHLGLCHPLSVYSGCLCCTCLSLSFGCLSLFVCMLNVSVSVCLYFPDLTIFILLNLSCPSVLFIPYIRIRIRVPICIRIRAFSHNCVYCVYILKNC